MTSVTVMIRHPNKFAQKSFTMIHVSKIFELAQVVKRFSIAWVSESGRRIYIDDAVFTSGGYYSLGRTMNIRCVASGEIRKVKVDTIIEFNGQEVFI